MERPASYAPAEAIESADSAESDFDFDDFLNEMGVDLETRDATLVELEATYGGRVFRYGQYTGTVADMAVSCPAFRDILEQGVGAATSWLESNDEPEAEEDEDEKIVADGAEDETPQSEEPQQAEQSKEVQSTVDDRNHSAINIPQDIQHPNDKTENETPDASTYSEAMPDTTPIGQHTLQHDAPVVSREIIDPNSEVNVTYDPVVQNTVEQLESITPANSSEPQVEVEPQFGDVPNANPASVNNELVQSVEADDLAKFMSSDAVVEEAAVEQPVVVNESVDAVAPFAKNEYTVNNDKVALAGADYKGDVYEDSVAHLQDDEPVVNATAVAVKEAPLDEVDFWHGSDSAQELYGEEQQPGEMMTTYDDASIDIARENNNFVPNSMTEQDTNISEIDEALAVEPSEGTDEARPVPPEVVEVIAELTGQIPDELPEVRTIDLYVQANATVRAIEVLEKARSAEDCKEALEVLRVELETLLQRLGYADAQAMAERLTRHYDIASLKKYIMLLSRTFLLEQMKDEKPQTLPVKPDVPYHRYGAQAVRMVVDFARSSTGYQNAAA